MPSQANPFPRNAQRLARARRATIAPSTAALLAELPVQCAKPAMRALAAA